MKHRITVKLVCTIAAFSMAVPVSAEEVRLSDQTPQGQETQVQDYYDQTQAQEMPEQQAGEVRLQTGMNTEGQDATTAPQTEETWVVNDGLVGEQHMTVKTDDFANAISDYLSNNGFENANYIISPLSLRAGLCLAIAGASGQTQEELLGALGFHTEEEAKEWYRDILIYMREFKEQIDNENARAIENGGTTGSRAFSVANSIWDNLSCPGDFSQWYKDYVNSEYGAEVLAAPEETLTDNVNGWCSEKTEGMIPYVSKDLSGCASVLVNALYLRSTWTKGFEKQNTKDGVFTTYDGKKVTKKFMEKTLDMRCYCDQNTALVEHNMDGNIQFVCVIGDTTKLEDKISRMETRKVHLVLPKFTAESSFEKQAMTDMLKSCGISLALQESADFSKIYEGNFAKWYLQGIIHKAKIKTDEDGIEASAVTEMIRELGSVAGSMDDEIIEFIADEPFSFYIYYALGTPKQELLFQGQIATDFESV